MPNLRAINEMPETALESELTRCCGSKAWVARMAAHRPFDSERTLLRLADEIWWSLSESDWIEAFGHHPRIGDVDAMRKRFAPSPAPPPHHPAPGAGTQTWSLQEQSGVNAASEETLLGLAQGNVAYDKKFGFVFLICATGRSAAEMLMELNARLGNDRRTEVKNAATEHAKIARIRLEKLLAS